MLSNSELTEIVTRLRKQNEDHSGRLEVLEHEVKILKRTIGMGNLEPIPQADYELSADTCPHLNWDRDYENDLRICKNCGHQEALY